MIDLNDTWAADASSGVGHQIGGKYPLPLSFYFRKLYMTLPVHNLWNAKGSLRKKACTTPNERTEPMTKRRIRATTPQRLGGPIHITTIKGDDV